MRLSVHRRPAATPGPLAPPEACGHLLTTSLPQRLLPGGSPPCAGHTVSDPQVTAGAHQERVSVSQEGELRCRKGVWRGGVEARALSVADVLGRMQHVEQDATATPAYSLEVK